MRVYVYVIKKSQPASDAKRSDMYLYCFEVDTNVILTVTVAVHHFIFVTEEFTWLKLRPQPELQLKNILKNVPYPAKPMLIKQLKKQP